jgi:DNA polymerase III subunit epsilon
VETFLIFAAIIVAFIVLIAYFTHRAQNSDPHFRDETPEMDPLSLSNARRETKQSASSTVDFSMLPQQFVVLDLETTGLDPIKHEIIEFGAIKVNLGSDTHPTFQTFVKPERKVPKRITEITGITQAMVDAEGRPLAAALTEFMEFIQDLPVVTFNAEFDMGFLQNAARRNGFAISNRYTCALKLVRRAWPGLPSYRLADLAKMGNLADDDTHRALGDCRRAVTVFTSSASRIGMTIKWSRLPKESLAQN